VAFSFSGLRPIPRNREKTTKQKTENMKMTKDECNKCGSLSTLRHPEGTVQCLECKHETPPPLGLRPRPAQPPPAITVGRYRKADGFPTRHFAIHIDGDLLAVTVYRKGAEAVRLKFLEALGSATQVEITTPK
jgi:hypothetical protein